MLKTLETELKIRGFSNQTIKTYLYHNKNFIKFFKRQNKALGTQKTLVKANPKRYFEDVKESDIKTYLAYLISDKKLSSASVNLVISTLKFMYQTLLKKPIFNDIKAPKIKKKIPIVLSYEEIKALIDVLDNKKHKLIIKMLYSSGLRVSELVNIKINDLDLKDKTGIVRSGKGGKDRNIILSEKLVKDIEEYLFNRKKKSEYLFNVKKKHLSIRQAQDIVKKASIKANINKNVFCHAIRASFATHLLEQGTDIRIIQELLGHSNLSTTEKYTKISKEQIKKVKSPLDFL
jgi:integrase/recombinase XerD